MIFGLGKRGEESSRDSYLVVAGRGDGSEGMQMQMRRVILNETGSLMLHDT